VTKAFATEIYIVLIAICFTGLGIWAGYRLTPKGAATPFERNDAALKTLGLTDREVLVLERLAAGDANKEIARALDISPNTVKTHIANLFQKLEVERRTQAIQKARELRILP
jgi:ATP/maltotriose-dependent transcriptional regulator MalT